MMNYKEQFEIYILEGRSIRMEKNAMDAHILLTHRSAITRDLALKKNQRGYLIQFNRNLTLFAKLAKKMKDKGDKITSVCGDSKS